MASIRAPLFFLVLFFTPNIQNYQHICVTDVSSLILVHLVFLHVHNKKKGKGKLSLKQGVKSHRVVRCRGVP
jgi:hypothetical protein